MNLFKLYFSCILGFIHFSGQVSTNMELQHLDMIMHRIDTLFKSLECTFNVNIVLTMFVQLSDSQDVKTRLFVFEKK